MKWVGIVGSWRKITPAIENDIRNTVSEIMNRGNGIVSGGALNVDSIALDEALKDNPEADRIKIFLPTTLEKYEAYYKKHVQLGDLTTRQQEDLIKQLSHLEQINHEALIENPDTNFNEETKKVMYNEQNSRVVEASDELVAFHVKTHESEGKGTLDTIEKARAKDIPVRVFSYDFTKK